METRETVSSRIQVTFEGLMVLFVEEGGQYCDVGLLKHAPGHIAHLLVTKIPKKGAPQTILHLHDKELDEPRLWLDVQKAHPRIHLYTNGSTFDRKNHGDDEDFRWRIDFPELYKTPIAHDKNAFRSFLRINDGTFYTQQKSENQLVLKRPGEKDDTIGKVAVRFRCEIELTGDEVAYFSNGTSDKPIPLPAEKDVEYGIYVGLVREDHDHDHDHSASHLQAEETDIDAEYYYTALAIDKPPSRKIHFGRDVRPRATPDAVCFPPTGTPPGY